MSARAGRLSEDLLHDTSELRDIELQQCISIFERTNYARVRKVSFAEYREHA